MDGVSGAITIAKGIQAQIGVETKDAQTAKAMTQQAAGTVFMAKAMLMKFAQQDEKLASLNEVAKSLRVTTKGNNILLQAEASLETVNQLIEIIKQQR